MNSNKYNICIIGLGYVGLPLAIEFGKKFLTIGYDINIKRIDDLNNFKDSNNEIATYDFKKSKKLFFSNNETDITNSNVYILTLPTPINKKNQPELTNIKKTLKKISCFLKKKDIIIFESTFYPGLTDEICIPLIEKISKLKVNKDFGVGYSPERINPSDNKRKLKNIVKLVSASNIKTLNKINFLYKTIIKAGTYKVSSIKIAEAAKVIENTQRDINIAFVNHLKCLFDKINLNSYEIFRAASTKWNYLNFKPGLVGGHCIGIDPYYLAHKANLSGFNPSLILAGRKINDHMPRYYALQFLKIFKEKNIDISKSKILFLGVAFKENCSDIRNSKVFEIIKLFKKKFKLVDIVDPLVNKDELLKIHKISSSSISSINLESYDGIFIAVAHKMFKKLKIRKLLKKGCILYDIKSLFLTS